MRPPSDTMLKSTSSAKDYLSGELGIDIEILRWFCTALTHILASTGCEFNSKIGSFIWSQLNNGMYTVDGHTQGI